MKGFIMSKKKKYLENASVGMALMDGIPVLLFIGSISLLGAMFKSPLFIAGASLCALAGFCKVLWKFMLAVPHKNISLLNRQFRYVMSGGFLIILLSLIIEHDRLNASVMWKNLSSFPGNILFILGTLGMLAMLVMGIFMDASSKRCNYIEQSVNLFAQLFFFLGIVLVWYANDSYYADATAIEALNGNDKANIVSLKNDGHNTLLFDGVGNDTALIFYPGAKVEYTAYSPLMLRLAESGIDCFIVEMPYNMAIFGLNSAAELMENNEYTHWYIGGHSLGGAMAASYAAKHTDELDGLVLLAAYPTVSLKSNSFKVISIYGSEDGVLNMEKYQDGLKYMPTHFRELVISGGNHAGFGSYGFQTGDAVAQISKEEQWRLTVEEIIAFCFPSGL